MQILEQYLKNIEHIAFVKAGNYHDAKDLAQDVCVRVLTRRDLIEHLPLTEQQLYVNRLINNLFIDKQKAEAVSKERLRQFLQLQPYKTQPVAERRLIATETLEAIQIRWRNERFKLLFKQLVVLRYMGYRFSRISQLLNIPVGTALNNHRNALAYLKRERPMLAMYRGFKKKPSGTGKLKKDVCLVMKEMFDAGFRYKELGELFAVHEDTCKKIAKRDGWGKRVFKYEWEALRK